MMSLRTDCASSGKISGTGFASAKRMGLGASASPSGHGHGNGNAGEGASPNLERERERFKLLSSSEAKPGRWGMTRDASAMFRAIPPAGVGPRGDGELREDSDRLQSWRCSLWRRG